VEGTLARHTAEFACSLLALAKAHERGSVAGMPGVERKSWRADAVRSNAQATAKIVGATGRRRQRLTFHHDSEHSVMAITSVARALCRIDASATEASALEKQLSSSLLEGEAT
jgi:hypothetical protein